ncbi:Uncharacterised protein [Mycobacteroides abscessus subsp. abscessus]|nr:Uncharacterised protein [Mycobacteroides abscessus subsp. abscessus]
MVTACPIATPARYCTPAPTSTPIAAPTTPMPAASASTDRSRNLRLVPIARSTPSSRRRSRTESISVFSSATVATSTTIHRIDRLIAEPWRRLDDTAATASSPVSTW